MPLIYYLLIIVSANGTVTIAPPFSSEFACQESKKAVLLGHDTVKAHGNTVPPIAVGCQRVTSREEKKA